MVYLIMAAYQVGASQTKLHQAISSFTSGQCCAKGSVPGMAVRKITRLFVSYHYHGTRDPSWPRKPTADLSNGPLRAGFA